MSELAQAVVTRHHQLGGLNNRNEFSQCFGGWKSVNEVSAGLVSSEASFFGWLIAFFSLCLHMVIPLYPSVPAFSLLVRPPIVPD